MRTTLESIEQEVLREKVQEAKRRQSIKDYFQEVLYPLVEKQTEFLGVGFTYDDLKNIEEGFFERKYFLKTTLAFSITYHFGNAQHKISIASEHIDIYSNYSIFNDELVEIKSKTYILDIPEIKRKIKEILKEN